MNLLIVLAALNGGFGPEVAARSDVPAAASKRLLSFDAHLDGLVKSLTGESPPRVVELHRSLSLFLHDRFSGGAGVAGTIELLPGTFFQLGLVANAIRPGVEVGVVVAPFQSFLSANLSFEAGHYFPGDAASMLRALTANSKLDCSLLQNFSHDFASGFFGLEVGRKHFTLSLKGGLTHAELSTLNVHRVVETHALSPSNPILGAKIAMTVPSAKLGLTIRL